MEKVNGAELGRRMRVMSYKRIMIYVFSIMTILPVFTSIFLLYKVNRLEKRLDYAINGEVDDQTVIMADAVVDEGDTVKQEGVGKRVYLTFDDGPSIYTGQILDILAENDVKATFFVIGRDEQYYEYYKRIVDEGHTIGMHSYTHVYEDFYEL